MTEQKRHDGPDVFPVLRYRDGARAMDWLAQAFGFENRAAYPGPDGDVMHGEMAIGGGMIMLGGGGGRADPANPWSSTPQGVYVVVDDIDAHYARAREAGAEIVIPLRDTDYGAREYSARDPEGHLWSFGTYRPGRD